MRYPNPSGIASVAAGVLKDWNPTRGITRCKPMAQAVFGVGSRPVSSSSGMAASAVQKPSAAAAATNQEGFQVGSSQQASAAQPR